MPIVDQIAAREAFTRSLIGNPPPKQLTAAETEDTLFGWIYKQPGMATLEDCRQMYRRIAAERGEQCADGLLKRFGVHHISKLPPMLWEQFFKYASTSLYYGASPLFGWEAKEDVVMPEFNRDRWLFWDVKRQRLTEVRNVCPPELDEIEDGKLIDVSGVLEYEERWYKQLKGNKK